MSKYIDVEFEMNHYTSMTTHPTPDVTEQDKRNSLIILNALRMARRVETKQIKYFDEDEKVWKTGSVIMNEQNNGHSENDEVVVERGR